MALDTYLECVEHFLAGIDNVSSGACPGCAGCGLEDVADMDDERYDLADEPGFSWSQCEGCGSTFGGDRYPAHGFVDGEVVHLSVCSDCYVYLANGDEPEEPWYRTPAEYREATAI